MNSYNIRLNSILSFDKDTESDIIELIERLSSRHKTGQFLSNVIRLAAKYPEMVDMSTGEVLVSTDRRNEVMNERAKELKSMKKKVDDIYEMVYKMYTLVLMKKHLGLEQKVENCMRAAFMVERQLNEFKAIDGSCADEPFLSNKIKDLKEFADKALEYIIDTYDGVVAEIREQVTPVVVEKQVVQVETAPVHMKHEPVEVVAEEKQVEQEEQLVEQTEEEEEVLDFGMDGLGDLANFFGA